MSNCPSCHRELPDRASVCLKCGADLRPSKMLWFLAIGSVALAAASMWISLRPG